MATRIGEEDLGELGRTVDLLDRTNLDTRLIHGAQQVRDALVLGRIGIGAAQQEHVIGDETLCRPDLLSVDHPLVTVEHRLGAECREIGTGIGFAESLAPGDGAREDLGQELLLLLLGAPLQDRRSHQGVAEEVRAHRRPGIGELLGHDDGFHRGESLAAVFLGPRRADPSAAVQLAGPFLEEQSAVIR
jgi:hypothetical protein